MKLVWRGSWKKGEILVETESPDELINAISRLESVESISSPPLSTDTSQISSAEIPQIPGNLGPSEAVRQVLCSAWGRQEPRTMNEMMKVLEASAIYYSKGTLSGILANMTKKGELRRPLKKEDQWAYVSSG